MNLKKFKKIKDEQDKAIFRNDKGHEITVAKKELTKSQLNDLNSLPLHAADGADIQQPLPAYEQAPQPQLQEQGAVQQQMAAQPVEQQLTPQQKYDQARAEYINQNAAQLGEEAAKWDHDQVNGHITPKTYQDLFAKKDTLGKIGTVFGMLLSGAGSGLAHQPSAMLDLMNKELDRDLEAQKQSKENARNYMSLNVENELRKANIGKMTTETQGLAITNAKNQMLLNSVHHLQDLNNRLPLNERAKGQQILDVVIKPGAMNQIQQNNLNTAQALADHPEGGFQQKMKTLQEMEMLGMPEAGKVRGEMQEQHVPGYGDSSIPVPKDVRDELIGKMEYDRAAKAYIDFANKYKNNWMNLDPKSREQIKNQGIALATNVQNMSRAKNNGGVWKAGEQSFIENSVPNQPATWSAGFNAIPKLQQTIKDNEAETRNLAKGHGLPFESFSGQAPQQQQQHEPAAKEETIERRDPKSGKIVIYDAKTKKPLRWK